MVGYSGAQNRPRYRCLRAYQSYGSEKCQSLSAVPLDEFVSRQILYVLTPATIELSLKAVEQAKQERQRVTKLRRQRLERAQYEADRAARQYHAVEPENRLVARQLEGSWEEALRRQRELEEDLRRLEHAQPVELKSHELEMIKSLSIDLPTLWNATGTTAADRKTIVRHLIERVVVDTQGESERVDVEVHWSGGFVSQHELIRPVASYRQLSGYCELMARIEDLRNAGRTSTQIADQMNDEGFHPPNHKSFDALSIRRLLSRHGKSHDGDRTQPSHWRLRDLAEKLEMPTGTLRSWLRRGWLHGTQLEGARGRWILWADDDELHRAARSASYCARSNR
jgi:hypothetical protein